MNNAVSKRPKTAPFTAKVAPAIGWKKIFKKF